jgi:hypothetical protein
MFHGHLVLGQIYIKEKDFFHIGVDVLGDAPEDNAVQ